MQRDVLLQSIYATGLRFPQIRLARSKIVNQVSFLFWYYSKMFLVVPFPLLLQLLLNAVFPIYKFSFYRSKSLLLAEWEFLQWDFPQIQWIFIGFTDYWVHYLGRVKLRNNYFCRFPDNLSKDNLGIWEILIITCQVLPWHVPLSWGWIKAFQNLLIDTISIIILRALKKRKINWSTLLFL